MKEESNMGFVNTNTNVSVVTIKYSAKKKKNQKNHDVDCRNLRMMTSIATNLLSFCDLEI